MTETRLNKNIVLIGFMGSGKTMASKSLSKKLKAKRFSTDEIIIKTQRKSIAKIVENKGWDYFRNLEHKLIKKLSHQKGIIIDCGGGIVLNPLNIKLLKKNGVIFYLKTKPSVIYNRVKDDKSRPLVNVPNPLATIKEILKSRLPLYKQADFAINSNDPDIEKAVIQILKKIK